MPGNRRGRATRERLLDAAEAVMAERGIGFTVDDVAGRAATSRPTVHRHFGTRDELVVAVLLRASARLADVLDEVWAGPGAPADRFGEVVVRTVEAIQAQAFLTWIRGEVNPGTAWPDLDPDDRFLTAVRDFYRPMLVDLAGPGGPGLRAPVEVALDWLLRCILLLVQVPSALGDDAAAVRRDVVTFVVPSLVVADVPG